MFENLSPYLRLTRIDRPIGAFLLLWPTLWALWLATNGHPDPNIVVLFIVGTFAMRAAGCAINDYADRNFDGEVARTNNRPLATGALSPAQALATFFILIGVAFILVLQFNAATIRLAFLAVFITALYPFTKRFTHLPQLFLGIAFSWGIPMAYTATTGQLHWHAWAIFAANFCWSVAYDTWYAMADREDDLRIGVKSTAILLGDLDLKFVGGLQIASLLILAWIGVAMSLSWHFYCGLFAAALFSVYQQVICRGRDRDQCFRAFLNNNWFGAVVFVGILLATLERGNVV